MTTLAHDRERARRRGALLFWIALIVLGLVLLAVGVDAAPSWSGLLPMIGGGLILGASYAEVIWRLPTMTHRYWLSITLAALALAIVVGVLVLNANALTVPPADPDALLTPAGSSGSV